MSAHTIDRRLAALTLVSLFLTYCLFLQTPKGANQVSRIAVALSIVQDGTLSIDRFERFTIDKAYYDNHFFSDKAPGMAILAVPLVYAARFALKRYGLDAVTKNGELTHFVPFVYVSTVLTSGLLTAVAAAALFLTARSLGASQVGALFGAFSYGVGTPAFGWATAFFGHATAGACLFLAFAALVALQREHRHRRYPLLLAGFVGGMLGLAVIVEFTTIPAAAIIMLFALRIVMGFESPERWGALVSGLTCSILVITPLGIYNYLAFGSPMHLGYESVMGFVGMKQGLMGVGFPKLDVLEQILFSRYRGLFVFSPILFFALWSTLDAWRKSLLASEHFVVIIAVVTSFVAINAGYCYWDGGWSTGPRFLTPMIALLCLPLALQWSSIGLVTRGILIILFIASLLISLATTSVTMTVSSDYKSPLTNIIIPEFLRGHLSSSVTAAAGWPSWTVMIPLIMIWVSIAAIAMRLIRRGSQSRSKREVLYRI